MLRLITILIATALVTAAAATPAHAGRYCGTFTDSDGARIAVQVNRGTTSCKTAKRILRGYINSNAPCSGSGCARRITGWRCSAAMASAFPRLVTCTRKRATIAAYSTAD